MNADRQKIYQLLTNAGFNAFHNYIPQSATLPAVSYTLVATPSDRILDGSKSGRHAVWRLQLVAMNATDLQTLENTLELLDNTGNVDYNRILVDPLNPVPQDTESVTHVTSVDIRTYF